MLGYMYIYMFQSIFVIYTIYNKNMTSINPEPYAVSGKFMESQLLTTTIRELSGLLIRRINKVKPSISKELIGELKRSSNIAAEAIGMKWNSI